MATATAQRSTPRGQANGLLPVTASQTSSTAAKTSSGKAAAPRLKVIIRRLAPGLTEAEFTKILGEQWQVGQGKVDWFRYKAGKDSKDASKPSRPSRAYLHLTSDTHLMTLSDTVHQLSFEDARNTWNSPSLIGPPSVEFAPYGRTSTGRRRTDGRQGTIDQDPEFMDFLETLINPVTTRENLDEAAANPVLEKGHKVTTTPLVQFLKDKKANKSKDTATTVKGGKQARQEPQSGKTPGKSAKDSSSSPEDTKKSAKEAKKERLVEKAARDTVKVLSRGEAAKASSSTSTPASEAKEEPPKSIRVAARERGSVAAAARILQRDLGLTPGVAHRRAKINAENASKENSEPPSSSSAQSSAAAPITKGGSPSSGRGGRGGRNGTSSTAEKRPATTKESTASASTPPITLLKKSAESAAKQVSPQPPAEPTAQAPPTSRKASPLAVPSAGATRAFVKHANPSQGVTEVLLKEAMEVFGAVSHVEIDKRKGFAYVDFVTSDGLVKAMAANPTKIAQGTVQVLERKDTKAPRDTPPGPSARGGFPTRGGRGGSGRRGGRGSGGRGGGAEPSSSNMPTASSAPASSPQGLKASSSK